MAALHWADRSARFQQYISKQTELWGIFFINLLIFLQQTFSSENFLNVELADTKLLIYQKHDEDMEIMIKQIAHTHFLKLLVAWTGTLTLRKWKSLSPMLKYNTWRLYFIVKHWGVKLLLHTIQSPKAFVYDKDNYIHFFLNITLNHILSILYLFLFA